MAATQLQLSPVSQARRVNLKWSRFADDVIPAWVAESDLGPGPAALDLLRQRVDEANLGYDADEERLGALLGDALSSHLQRRYDWALPAAHIRPLNDIGQGIVAALCAYTEPGDGIVVQTPSYPRFRKLIESCGRRFVANPLRRGPEGYQLDLEHLADCLAQGARAIVLCNPHNPTGRVFSVDELRAIAAQAEQHGAYLIVDEVHADLVFDGQHVPLASLQASERVVTLASTSKSFNLQALRCAAIAFGSEELLRRFDQKIPAALLGSPSPIGIKASAACWAHGDAYLHALLEHLRNQRDRITRFFQRQQPRVGFASPQATYLYWLDFSDFDLPQDAASYLLANARVALSAGQHFSADASAFARLNFATSTTLLDELLERIGAALAGSGR